MSRPALSILDLVPVAEGVGQSRAIREAIELARRADALGYTRYWFAEHHNTKGNASSSPEVMIAQVLATTTRLRVGAGGMMVPSHAMLRVVESFRTLEAMHPGRVDLGLGRSLGTDPVTSEALRKRGSGDDADEQLIELLAFATKQFPDEHPFATIDPVPTDAPLPPVTLLGSSRSSAALAASLGLGFAFGGHYFMAAAETAIATYRKNARTAEGDLPPRVLLSVWAVCGATDAEARELAEPLRLAYARINLGGGGPLPSVRDAAAHSWSADERAAAAAFDRNMVVGSAARVVEQLEALARTTTADEILIASAIPGEGARLRSYERIAEAAGLR